LKKEEKENSKFFAKHFTFSQYPGYMEKIGTGTAFFQRKTKKKKKKTFNFSERNNSNQECLPAPLILSFTLH